ncbi:MAG TPA: glycosyltransferase family 39 protein [Gemmatimonadaceae bacterium]|nr:glycosyltransferase family 39 protein [Gemmatimonadaceae bacterium]
MRRQVLLDVVVLAIVALAVRLVDLDFAPDIDELDHLLAVRSLFSNGTLDITGIPYTRARLFTYLVAGFAKLFGPSIVVARLPSVIAGSALVVAVYLWVRHVSSRGAGWIAALLLCFYPMAIFMSQVVRFYMLQALLVWMGATIVYGLCAPGGVDARVSLRVPGAARGAPSAGRPSGRRAYLRMAGAAAAFLLALHLQLLTLVALLALGVWCAAVLGPRIVRRISVHPSRAWIVTGLAVVGTLLALAMLHSGRPTGMVRFFHYSDYWAVANRHNLRFYDWALTTDYATVWSLFPVVVLLAASARPRVAGFCATVFVVGFLFHSFAAWKAMRYFLWVMPFFFALSGIATMEAVSLLRPRLMALLERAPAWLHLRRWAGVLATAFVGVTLVFFVLVNGAFSTTYHMLAPASGDPSNPKPFRGKSDWAAASARLHVLSDSSAVLVSSSDLKPLYYLHRLDFILQRDHLYSMAGWAPEFTLYRSVKRPVVSTPQSLQRIVSCYPSGLVIAEDGQWRQPWGVPVAATEYLTSHLRQIPLPSQWHLKAFRWSTGTASHTPGCSELAAVAAGQQ